MAVKFDLSKKQKRAFVEEQMRRNEHFDANVAKCNVTADEIVEYAHDLIAKGVAHVHRYAPTAAPSYITTTKETRIACQVMRLHLSPKLAAERGQHHKTRRSIREMVTGFDYDC